MNPSQAPTLPSVSPPGSARAEEGALAEPAAGPARLAFTSVAFLDDVCITPGLLTTYADAFDGVTAARLAIYAPGTPPADVLARLEGVTAGLRLDERDVDVTVYAVDASDQVAEKLASTADAVYAERPGRGPFAGLPSFGEADVQRLLETARRSLAAWQDAGVFVLGPHRSGTSATARLINLLGVPLNVESDWLVEQEDNPTGFWESTSLVEFNDAILERLGCVWWAPPRLASGWHLDPTLADLRARGRAAFKAAFPTDRWVWKDPRTSLTFGFWRRVLNVRPAVVLAYRNPLEVARSLSVRNDITKVHGLALWERHLRQALADVAGLPVFVTGYDRMLGDVEGWYGHARGFLGAHGFEVRGFDDWRDDAAAFLDAGLRHSKFDDRALEGDIDVLPQQLALYRFLAEREGVHEAFSLDDLPDESGWLDAFLMAKRDWHLLDRKLS